MKIIDNDGEVDTLIEDLLEINKSELEDKLDGYEGFVKYLEGQISYLKEMEAHYLKRRRVLEKSVKRWVDGLQNTADETADVVGFNLSIGLETAGNGVDEYAIG